MLDLLFSDILLLIFLGLIVWTDLSLPCVLMSCRSYHIDVERENLVGTLHHVDAWEWLVVNLHGELPQDQLALLNG
jgi:hypothetical protein